MIDKKSHDKLLQWLTLVFGIASILFSATLYVANMDKRISLLEQSNMQINERFDKMEAKIDRIYLALPTQKN